ARSPRHCDQSDSDCQLAFADTSADEAPGLLGALAPLLRRPGVDSIQHAPRLDPQQAFLRATLWCFLLFCLGSFSVDFCSSCTPRLRILATQGAPAQLIANPRSQA